MPQAVIDDNSNLNSVDMFVQRLSNYKIDRRSKKWWHNIFLANVNSNKFINDWSYNKSAKDFRRSIINALLSETLVNPKRNFATIRY